MIKPNKDRPLYQKILFDVLGFAMMLVSPLLGWLPGPGGIPLFLAGLSLVALNHDWAANLLSNFEKKWKELVKKVIEGGPKTSLAIDVLALIALGAGAWTFASHDKLFLKLWGFGLMVLGITLIASNQRRIERLKARISKK